MNLRQAIIAAMDEPGFAGFGPLLEEQIRRDFDRLYFRKDVSGGRGQAFQTCWVRISKEVTEPTPPGTKPPRDTGQLLP